MDAEIVLSESPQALGTPYDYPEWLGDEPLDPNILSGDYSTPAIIPYGDIFQPSYVTTYDVVSDDGYMVARLESIDHSLKIVSGGIVLAACVFWLWLTVIRPLKMFTGF